MPAYLHLPAAILAAFLGGGAWAAIPALLRVYLNVNELVVCLMLNPIALLLTGFFATHVFKAPGPTNKLPDILKSASLPTFSLYSQVNAGLILALACCALFALVNARTIRGFEWKIMGLNPRFAYYGGIDVPRRAIWVMMLSGAIAGLAGAEQVLGVYGAFYDNFSPGYGFDGIAVAMLANFDPIGVVLAAFLFGALNAGSAVLQMMTGLSKYLVQVLQFIIVLVLAAQFSWEWLKKRRIPATPGYVGQSGTPKKVEAAEIKEA
jgi:simple sugar transport system permease protein